MIEITINGFINTLLEAISASPTSVVTLIVGIIFLIAMIISMKKFKKIGKFLFIIGWLFIIIFIILKYSTHLTTLFDNFMNNVFMQIFFPNLATYVIIIAITNFIFLFTILKGSKISNKIINSLFFTVIILLLILILDIIFKNEINIYEKLTVYSNKTLLILLEATTITFILWLIILSSKFIVGKLIAKSDKKVKEKYQRKTLTDNILVNETNNNDNVKTEENITKNNEELKEKAPTNSLNQETHINENISLKNSPATNNTKQNDVEILKL